MKWVFFALVALNIWYFSTNVGAIRPDVQQVAPPPPASNAVNRMLLLSELGADELRVRGEAAADRAASGSEQVSAASASAAGGAAQTASSEGAQPMTTADGKPLPVGVCLSFGPLSEAVSVKGLREWLIARGGLPQLRERERRELSRYWVYFPPFPSRVDATKRVEAMRSRGIEDIFIIPKGDMSNAVSLGVYSRKESLDRRLNQLRKNGYEPTVAPRYKTERATWLDAVFADGFVLDNQAFGAAFAAVEVSDVRCTRQDRAKLASVGASAPGAAPDTSGQDGAPAPGTSGQATPTDAAPTATGAALLQAAPVAAIRAATVPAEASSDVPAGTSAVVSRDADTYNAAISSGAAAEKRSYLVSSPASRNAAPVLPARAAVPSPKLPSTATQ